MNDSKYLETLGRVRIVIQVLILFFGLWSVPYTMDHFSSRGCDGGTCALFLFVYSIPLVLTLLFLIGMVSSSFRKSKFTFLWAILAGLGLFITAGVGIDSGISALSEPIGPMVIVYVLCLVVYFTIAKRQAQEEPQLTSPTANQTPGDIPKDASNDEAI